jgi:hypothetical protein
VVIICSSDTVCRASRVRPLPLNNHFPLICSPSALSPAPRFALKLRTDIEPYLSIFYSNEQQRLADMGASEAQEKAEMWDVEEIEREKEEEEYRWAVAKDTHMHPILYSVLSYPVLSYPFLLESCPLTIFPVDCGLPATHPPRCESIRATPCHSVINRIYRLSTTILTLHYFITPSASLSLSVPLSVTQSPLRRGAARHKPDPQRCFEAAKVVSSREDEAQQGQEEEVSIRLMRCTAPLPAPFFALCSISSLQIFCIHHSALMPLLQFSSIILHTLTRTLYVIFPHRRVLTGAGWSQIIDPVTFIPFWYNDDTGEANYATPKIVEERYECLHLFR